MESQVPALTIGILVKDRKFKKLFLDRTIPIPSSEKMNFLVIYAVGTKMTRITSYPVLFNEIFKITFVLKECHPDIIQKVASIVGSDNLIHTTGLCEKGKKTVVENYYLPKESWATMRQMMVRFENQPEFVSVSIEQIKLK
jgi:hypothetical protein